MQYIDFSAMDANDSVNAAFTEIETDLNKLLYFAYQTPAYFNLLEFSRLLKKFKEELLNDLRHSPSASDIIKETSIYLHHIFELIYNPKIPYDQVVEEITRFEKQARHSGLSRTTIITLTSLIAVSMLILPWLPALFLTAGTWTFVLALSVGIPVTVIGSIALPWIFYANAETCFTDKGASISTQLHSLATDAHTFFKEHPLSQPEPPPYEQLEAAILPGQ